MRIASGVQIIYLIIAAFIAVGNYMLRSQRWRVLLEGEWRTDFQTVFWSNILGYLGNNLLPARAGDIMRAYILGEKAKISKTFIFTTGITERIIDVIALVVIAIGALMALPNMPEWLVNAVRWMGLFSIIGIVGMQIGLRYKDWLISLIPKLPLLGANVKNRLAGFSENIIKGLSTLNTPKKVVLYITFTGLIWLIDALGSMVSARSLGLDLQLPQSFLFLVGLGLSSAIPSTPGYIGVYQFVAVSLLPLFGFTRNEALTYILIAQTTNYIVTMILGMLAFWRININPKKVIP